MANYKINFKDSNCQYVEDYNAGKYGTKVKIYFCEGNGCCPKQYSGSVGAEMITADTIEELKLKLDRALAKRDKEIAKTLKDSKKVKDSYGEWDYEISCEGNKWSDEGFESEDEAEDEAISKVEELLSGHFPADYTIDDFDITIINNETGETYIYDAYADIRDSKKKAKDCNMATLTPGNVKLKRASKKFNQINDSKDLFTDFRARLRDAEGKKELKSIKDEIQDAYDSGKLNDNELRRLMRCFDNMTVTFNDAKFCDATADDIIDLFHEAYAKNRTWDWLKNKLPKEFLNFSNRNWKSIFPIQADRTGNLEGVYLTKPKMLSSTMKEEINKFLDAFENYFTTAEVIKNKYNIDNPTYDEWEIEKILNKLKETTDSKSEEAQISKDISALSDAKDKYRNAEYKVSGFNIGYGRFDSAVNQFKELGREKFFNKVARQVNKSRYGKEFKEDQRKPLIESDKGGYIRSDSKVGPLTPEAEAYIRRVMGGSSTEDITAKREARRNKEKPQWLGWEFESRNVNHDRGTGYGYKNDEIVGYRSDVIALKNLLKSLKEESAKESKMDIDVTNRRHGHYKYTGKGPYDYNGRWVGERRGGYEFSNETVPASVSINVQGLNKLSTALADILNSPTVADVEENLKIALEIAKSLPRSNPKVAEIKAKIRELLDKYKGKEVKKVPLPDKKYRDSKFRKKRITDKFSYEEGKEFMELCRKLGLATLKDINNFSKEHGNVQDQKLLEALRKEVKDQDK